MKKNSWNGYDLCEKSINIVIDSLKRNKEEFKTIFKRGNLYLYHRKKLVYKFLKSSCLNENENFNDYLPLISGIRKDIDNYINKNNFQKIPINNSISVKSNLNYCKLKNYKIFHEIDIKEAYFQIMHILGYISDNIYNKFSHFEEYKQAYIYGITWLQSDEIVREYRNGKLIKEYNKFRPEYKIIYNNVRYFINDLTDEAMKICTPTGFFKKQVDAIYCDIESSKNVCEFYRDHGIEIKITHLVKYNDTHIIKKGEVKKF